MTDRERITRLRALLDDVGSRDDLTGPGAGTRIRLRRVCELAVTELGVDGAGVAVVGDPTTAGARDLVYAHDPVSRDLEDAHLTTGQGPCLDALRGGRPVAAPDLVSEEARWPGFVAVVLALGVAAVFSFPLQVGAVQLGSLTLWRRHPGALTSVGAGLVLAEAATEALLDEIASHDTDRPAGDGASTSDDGGGLPGSGWLPDVHAEVHQASGMVAVDLGIGVGPALLRLRSYAFSRAISIGEIAHRVVHQGLRLDADE